MDEVLNRNALLEAFNAAPAFIREFISSGEFAAFTKALGAALPLSDEQRSAAADELFMTLLGITTPADLPDNLQNAAGIPEELIPAIIEEAREGVFEPLIARGGGEPAPDLPMVVPAAPARPTEAATTPASPLATFHAEAARIVPQTQPAPVRPPAPPAPPRPVPPPPRVEAVPPPAPTQPAAPSVYETFHARTMASDIEAMQPGKGGVPKPQGMPARAAVPAPAPAAAPKQPAAQAAPSVPPASEVHADLRQYGIDPYREPIE